MDSKVKEQILAFRDTGLTNMFNTRAVQRIAHEMNFFELVVFLEKHMPGYVDMIEDLSAKFPISEPQIIGEHNQKDFISLFGAILRLRNLLSSFDEFAGKEMITERDLQDYLGRYQDLRDE